MESAEVLQQNDSAGPQSGPDAVHGFKSFDISSAPNSADGLPAESFSSDGNDTFEELDVGKYAPNNVAFPVADASLADAKSHARPHAITDDVESESFSIEASSNISTPADSHTQTKGTQESDLSFLSQEAAKAVEESTGPENIPSLDHPTSEDGHEIATEDEDRKDSLHAEVKESYDSSQSLSPLLREQLKYCASIMRSMKRHRDASPFLQPVDAVALNIPDYYNIITSPMDFSTVTANLTSAKYDSVDKFIEDIRQVFKNCARYNAEGTVVNTMGKNMDKVFDNLLKKMPTEASLAPPAHASNSVSAANTPVGGTSAEISERAKRSSAVMKRRYDSPEFENTPLKKSSITDLRSPYKTPTSRRGSIKSAGSSGSIQDDLRYLGNLVKDFFKKQYAHIAWPFCQPVDPVALGIPDYFSVVTKPMDLGTIKQRIEHRVYTHPDEIRSDFLLMCNNCYAYNGPESDVARLGQQLESIFSKKFQQRPSLHAGSGSNYGDADDDFSYMDQQIREKQRQIQVLEAEIADLRSQKVSYQKKRLQHNPTKKKSSPSHHSTKKSRPVPVFSFEDKRQLSFDINELQPERLGRVLDIINESMPHLRSSDPDSDEIELDIETLNNETLYKLQKYVKQCKVEAASRGGSLVAPSYPMDLSSEEEDME